jgi:hypothetical protein
MKNETTTGGMTPEQIERLTRQHGELMLVTVEAEAEGETDLHFWFKKPDRKIMSAMLAVAQRDAMEGTAVLFRNCLINKDMEVWAEDVDVFLAVAEQLDRLVKKRKVSSQHFSKPASSANTTTTTP